jgi:hypothetical protein
LKNLNVKATEITEVGIKDLKQALPKVIVIEDDPFNREY